MPSQHFLVIVNPASGHRRGREVLEQAKSLFHAAGAELDVRMCERPRHALEIASAVDLTPYDGCSIIGGDGTVHEVVNGLLSRGEKIELPLGLIPAGSGNTLHLHQGGHDVPESVRRILAGQTTALDVARVTTGGDVIYCINIVGWAAVVDINCLAEKMRFLGPMRYAVATMRFLVNPRPRLARLVLDDDVIDDEFLLIVGCITKYTGNGMLLAPQASIDDGMIDVVVVRQASRRELLQLFRKVFDGSHVDLPFVQCHQVRRFALEHDDQRPLNLDGESVGQAPFAVEMVQGALRIFA